MRDTEFFGLPRPRAMAHRGASGAYPENTVAAFTAAHQLGVRYIELDVHMTRDRRVVVAHDPDLARTAGRDALIRELSYEQLVDADAGFGFVAADGGQPFRDKGFKLPMLSDVEQLVRRDAPNILLSHNPNAFDRAAELGIEFTLAGHTHGGQINVEILESQINAARFMTDYVAGMYSQNSKLTSQTAHLYVNRGLGTVGAPVRVGAPPEITLFTLRRAS